MHELYSKLVGPFLKHEGRGRDDPRLASETMRGSGRYPKDSGENPHQHQDMVPWTRYEIDRMRKEEGLSMAQIAEYYGTSQNVLRGYISETNTERIARERAECIKLSKEKGMSIRDIAKETGLTPTTVRNRLADYTQAKIDKEEKYKEILREQIEKHGHLDVGLGNEHNLGVSETKMKQLVQALKDEGYVLSKPRIPQAGTGYDTHLLVLSKKGTPKNYIYNHIEEIKPMDDLNIVDLGDGPQKKVLHDPLSIDSKRCMVLYNEEGGLAKDGLVELRRGVPELNLGKSNYAQVRIVVDNSHYIKGMAVYADDLPDGVDIRFNTNKHEGTPMLGADKDNTVFKPLKGEGLNGFGATIRDQNEWTDAKGQTHFGVVNIVKEQGVWADQQKTLASQFLSKQPHALAKKQLQIDLDNRKDEFETIMSLTNPAIKQRMLKSYADECDAAAVHLKAAAIPRQAWNVIIPMTTLKPNEIYAPGFKDGEEVVCIRYPHGGKFELEQLTVNNRCKEGQKVIGKTAFDAVGITKASADKLSGADFDGDTVLVIPNPKRPTKNGKYTYDIQVRPALEKLKDFDPKEEYKGYPGMKRMSSDNTQRQMGIISNLITDMTIQGADDDELARAVKHSMVVIDAEKHGLDYKRSYKDNNIAELKKKYQKGGGVATLLSRAKSPDMQPQRVSNHPYDIDPETGRKIWNVQKPKTYIGKDGQEHTIPPRNFKSTKMLETEDAYTLVGDKNNIIEKVYADYANECKALGNRARKEFLKSTKTESIKYSKEAAELYSKEVADLKAKLVIAEKNAPRERAAQRLASQKVKMEADARALVGNEMTEGEKRKLLAKEITPARRIVGAKKQRIVFTDREWEAIQKGAINKTTLNKLLNNADEDDYKKRATPKERRGLSSRKIALVKQMLAEMDNPNSNLSMEDIAKYIGVSKSTISAINLGTYEGGSK